MNERFSFRGPATIGGVLFPVVRLLEHREGHDAILRSWEGETSFDAASTPAGFTGNLGSDGPVDVELSDGRRGKALVTSINFDGTTWTVTLQGTGPAPA
jgi:hypothetical protein